LETLPKTTGIYKFLDKQGEVLYIGKALNLNNRVKSYFNQDIPDRPRIRQMMPYVTDLETIETNNEIESLVLEAALVKELKPKYNTTLKDDKSYAYIFVTTKDKFPTLKIVRNISKSELKKGEIFGPYPSGSATKRIFTYLRKLYPFCTSCKPNEPRESLYYDLGLCPGPYHGHISEEDYRKNINEIIKFLKGRKKGQIGDLEKEMKRYSKEKNYEQAALLRDRIMDLKYLGEKVELGFGDSGSKYISKRKEILKNTFNELRLELGLNKLKRIECYDISNIQGKSAYGSMVVAENGEIRKDLYRIFKIKNMDTPNDPEMLKEVLERRFSDKNMEEESFSQIPDIVLIDGGKTQLSVVIKNIPENVLLVGISKGKHLKRSGKKLLDEFWIYSNEDKAEKIDIVNSQILINLRDEAHRFAITHHRNARRKVTKISVLDQIPGIGLKRRKLLLKEFKDVENIKKASFEELNKVLKNKTVSKKVFEYFRI
jgi:excinuclease ABC subunit C